MSDRPPPEDPTASRGAVVHQAARSAATFTRERAAGLESPETEGLYRLLVDMVQDYAIFALDPSGHILSWNAGAHRFKGYTADEIIGRHFSIFYPPERIAERFPQRELEVAAEVGRFEDEGWRIRKDGTRFWANVVITALRDETGTLVGFAKVTRDLSERRAAEDRRVADAHRLATAEAANRAKSEFLATMSHELRTPLNAIGGYVDLLLQGVYGAVPDAQHEVLERVRRSQQHLLAIISDLLDYSGIEAGRLTYRVEHVPLGDLLDSVAVMAEPQARRKGIVFERGDCPAGAAASADRARTEQILLNLLTNAVKFTSPGGRITVTCHAGGGRVAVRVADTGPGVPPEKQDAIFEPFVQLGRGLNTHQEGIGLGLAISRDLAQAMGGKLSVASVVGEGSTFTLELPAA